MLKKLVIRNFQKHKKRVIRFDPYVTVIVGPSDRGKSTIIRALRWVALNKPQSTNIIRWGAKYAKVALKTEAGTVTRFRSSSRNTYRLGKNVYKSFGNSVPPRISSALGIGEANFQRQHDRPYWFSLSAPEVGRELNSIVNLRSIDTTSANIARTVREQKALAESARLRRNKARETKKALAWVKEASKAFEAIEQTGKEIDRVRSKATRLSDSIRQILGAGKTQRCSENRAQQAEQVQAEVQEIIAVVSERDRLCNLIEELETWRDLQWETKRKLQSLETKLARVSVCPACGQPVENKSSQMTR